MTKTSFATIRRCGARVYFACGDTGVWLAAGASRRAKAFDQPGEAGLCGFESPRPEIRTADALVEIAAEIAHHPAERDTNREISAHDDGNGLLETVS